MTERRRHARRRLFYLAGGLTLAALNLSWLFTRLDRLAAGRTVDLVSDAGNLTAFNGIFFFALTMLLGSHNPVLERAYGLDRMLLTHRWTALATTGLFTLHALLRTIHRSILDNVAFEASFLYRLRADEWDIVLGRIGLLLLFVAAASGVWGQWLNRLRFIVWKRAHLAAYPAAVLGFAHGYLHGDDTAKLPFLPLWAGLFALMLADMARRARYVLRREDIHVWTLERTAEETRDTATLTLSRVEGEGPHESRRPGQFAILRVPSVPELNEPHPFSFSGSADGGRLGFTIKRVGDFSHRVTELPLGTPILVEGPYGVFLSDALERERLGLIAGGVGITPFLSLLRTMRARGTRIPTTLVWANSSRADIFAREELLDMVHAMPLHVIHAVSRASEGLLEEFTRHERESCVIGRICEPLMQDVFTGEERFYLCGPPAMQETALTGLAGAFGVRRRDVARELFFW